jgi:outer membrane receptor protein involved in Fe transport
VSEYALRLTNVQTVNANLLHQTRIGYTWKRTEQTPLSTAPSLQVAGYFTEGGATAQHLNDHERDLEVDDDVMFTQGIHSLKLGAQSLCYFVHNYDPDTFNGAYVFGGGSAPVLDSNNRPTGETTTLSPIQQYQRALQNLPGGSPTTYQITTGTPLVPFTQWRLALYAEDIIKLAPRFTLSAGLRYSLQTAPSTFANFAPRVAFSWAPDKKSSWVLHLRGGLFVSPLLLAMRRVYIGSVENARIRLWCTHQTTAVR